MINLQFFKFNTVTFNQPKNKLDYWFTQNIMSVLTKTNEVNFYKEDLEEAIRENARTHSNEFEILHFVSLPGIEPTVEIVLWNTPGDARILSVAEQEFRLRLNITKTINLFLPKFDSGIYPTLPEVIEILEDAAIKLQNKNTLNVYWK